MKELWDQIKETYRDNKEASWLFAAFIIAFLVICGPEIAKETWSENAELQVAEESERSTEQFSEYLGETENVLETEDGTERRAEEPETEAFGISGERLIQLQAMYGEDFRIPMVIPEESEIPYVRFADRFRMQEYPALILPEGQTDRSVSALEEKIVRQLQQYDGDWSVYVKNLSTNESFSVNDRPMKSASVMKLFIMGTVYKAFESGELERTEEVMNLVTQMITVSDNESSNALLYRLGDGSYENGIKKVDEFIREYGFSDMTVEYNGFNNPATNTDTENFNQVSARDCGKLLEDIYRRTWVSRSVSNEMEGLLLDQHTRYKIPAGLPEHVMCGNKTGEMDTTENDAAIIYAPDCDYILVVLSSDWNSKDQAISRIQAISSMVYSHFNSSH